MKKDAGIGTGQTSIPTSEDFARNFAFRGVSARHPEARSGEVGAGSWLSDDYETARSYASNRPGGTVFAVSRAAIRAADDASGWAGDLRHDFAVARPTSAPMRPEHAIPASADDAWEHVFGPVSRLSEDELINQALEEPAKWELLTPNQQAYAQKLRDVIDYMT